MNLLRNRVFRLPVIVIGVLAWLAVSNHCAIAAVEGTANKPMPSCHGAPTEEHAPGNHEHESGVECCKVLRATLLTASTDLAAYDALTFTSHSYVVGILPMAADPQTSRLIEWDTGPPGLNSFAESVLQRSVLAHAPPSLA